MASYSKRPPPMVSVIESGNTSMEVPTPRGAEPFTSTTLTTTHARDLTSSPRATVSKWGDKLMRYCCQAVYNMLIELSNKNTANTRRSFKPSILCANEEPQGAAVTLAMPMMTNAGKLT